MHAALARRLSAEALGTGALVAAVVGSGLMGARLTTDLALTLLINATATVAALAVLIAVLGPISRAHVNPAVTVITLLRREVGVAEASGYVVAQIAGALGGVAVANVMFGDPGWQTSRHHRGGAGLLLGEAVATAGLLFVIGALTRSGRGYLGPVLVPAWIGSAYFFTSSTSFANPAVTIGRSLSDSFAGIAPASVAPFIAAQVVGALIGAGVTEILFPRAARAAEPLDLPEAVHGQH